MSTDDATYVIAHTEGLDLTRFLHPDTVDRVRSLVPRSPAARQRSPDRKGHRRKSTKPVTIRVEGKLPGVDAFLTTTIARDAQAMARLYPVYYMLENSLRVVVKRVLSGNHGKDWWDNCTSTGLRRKVQERMAKETAKPWHGRRGQHEIYYSDFGDLSAIIQKNWDDFEHLFPTRPWIVQRLEELEHPRNVMAHHNPVSKADLTRIELYFDDWIKLLATRKDIIP